MSGRFGSGPPMIPHNVSPKRKRLRRDDKKDKKPPPQQLMVSHLLRRTPKSLHELQGPEVLIASELPQGFPPELAYRALAAYSLIRTLSIQLRLSPFTPNVFLRALMLPYPDRLMGKIHVALLRVLLPQLKMGYSYRDNGGGLCVAKRRRVDGVWWDLRGGDNLTYLDGITWPLFYDDYVHLTADHLWELMNDTNQHIDHNSFLFDSNPHAEYAEKQEDRTESAKVTAATQSIVSLSMQQNGMAVPSETGQMIAGIQTSPMQTRRRPKTRQLSPPPPVDSDSDVAMDSGSEFNSDMEEDEEDDDDDEDYGAMPRKRPRVRTRPRPRRNASTNGNSQVAATPKKSPPTPGSRVLEAYAAVSPGVFVSLRSQMSPSMATSAAGVSNSTLNSRLPVNGKGTAKRDRLQQSVPAPQPDKPAAKRMKPYVPNASVTAIPYVQTPIYLPTQGPPPVPPPNPKVMKANQLQNSMAPISKPPAVLLNHNGTRAVPSPQPTRPVAETPVRPVAGAPVRPVAPPNHKVMNAAQLQNSMAPIPKRSYVPNSLGTSPPPANGHGPPMRPAVPHLGMPTPAYVPQPAASKPYSSIVSGYPPQIQVNNKTVPPAASTWKPNVKVKVKAPEIPRLDPSEPNMNAYVVSSDCADSIQSLIAGRGIQRKGSESLQPPLLGKNGEADKATGREPNGEATSGKACEGSEAQECESGGSAIASRTTLSQATDDTCDESKRVEASENVSRLLDPAVEAENQTDEQGREAFPGEPDEWPQFTPIEAMRKGIPYHRLPLEEKLRVLEFLLDELLTVDSVALEFGSRGYNVDRQYFRYGDLPSKEELESLVNQDDCGICGAEGELLCCDGCIRSYHRQCIGMAPGAPLPEGKWLCPECTTVDPARFGTLRGGQKGSLDWFSLSDIEERDAEEEMPRTYQMKNVEFLVVHGFVFARQASDKCDELSSSNGNSDGRDRAPNQYLPLAQKDLYRLLQSIGPNIASRWPFSQIPLDPPKLWMNVYKPERTQQMTRYFAHRESFDPCFQLNLYRLAPLPLSMQSKGSNKTILLLSDYETQCSVADMRNLSQALSRDMSKDVEIARHLNSNTLLFNPYEMIANYLVGLETSLRRGCLLDEDWAIRNGVHDPQRWHREVRQCRSIKKLATKLVGLIDACHSRAFLEGWKDVASAAIGSKKEMFDTSSSTGLGEGKRYETLPDGWTPEREMARRRWQRARDSNILTLLSKDSFHLDGSAHTVESLAAKLGRKRKDDTTITKKAYWAQETVVDGERGMEGNKSSSPTNRPSLTAMPQKLPSENASSSTPFRKSPERLDDCSTNGNTNENATSNKSAAASLETNGASVGDTKLPPSKSPSDDRDMTDIAVDESAPTLSAVPNETRASDVVGKSTQRTQLHKSDIESSFASSLSPSTVPVDKTSVALQPETASVESPCIGESAQSESFQGHVASQSTVIASSSGSGTQEEATVAATNEKLNTKHESSSTENSETGISEPPSTEKMVPENVANGSLCISNEIEKKNEKTPTAEDQKEGTHKTASPSEEPSSKSTMKPLKRLYKKKAGNSSKRTRRSGRLHDRHSFSEKIGSIIPGSEHLSLEVPTEEATYNEGGHFDQVAVIDNERKRRLNRLEMLVVHPDEKVPHWPLAGRKLFEPLGYLPSSEMRRLGRNAGLVAAEFVRYTASEVGEVSLYHAWRKRMLMVNSFEDLIAQIRILDSFLDSETQRSCESLGRRTGKAKSQIQKKVLFKQRDIKTGAMLYFVVNESRGRRRGCWTTSESIDLSALILERSLCIDAKLSQCEQTTKTSVATSVAPSSRQVAPQARKPFGGTGTASTSRVENPSGELSLAAQLAVAKANAEMERVLLQHEVDTGRLIVRCRELGISVVPVTEMASLRVETVLQLKQIFAVLEQYGSSRKSESFMLSLLSGAEKAASEKFQKLQILYQKKAAPLTLGGVNALAGQGVTDNRLTTSTPISAGNFVGQQTHSAPADLSTGSRKYAEPQSGRNEALAGAYLGTAYLDTGRSVHNDKLLYADTSDARAVEAAMSLATLESNREAAKSLAALQSNHETATSLPALSSNHQPAYGFSFLGDQTVANTSQMASSHTHSYHQSVPSQQTQAIPNQQTFQPYQSHQPVAQAPNQQYAAFQPPGSYIGQSGLPVGTSSATSTVPEGYTMQDLTPRPIEEMQKQPSGEAFNGAHHSSGGQWGSY